MSAVSIFKPPTIFTPPTVTAAAETVPEHHHTAVPTAGQSAAVVNAPAGLGGSGCGIGGPVMAAPAQGPSSPPSTAAAAHARSRTHARALALLLLASTVFAGLFLGAALRAQALGVTVGQAAAILAAAAAVLGVNALLSRAWSVPRTLVHGQRYTDLCRIAVTSILCRQLRLLVAPSAAGIGLGAWVAFGSAAVAWLLPPAIAFAAATITWTTVLALVADHMKIPESKVDAILDTVRTTQA